jgi:macrolide-specific efflux system membrane fusion protein
MEIRSTSRLFAMSAALVLALALCGCNSHPAAEASPIAAPKPAAPEGTAAAPESSANRPFITAGPLVADQQADVGAERDGRIARVAVEIGDHVREGQLMASLDDRVLRAACEAQKAKVNSLEAQVKEWEAEQKAEEADLRRADIMRAEKIRSEEDWEHVKYKLDETIAEVARYKADQAAADADLKSANLALEQSRIVAPFAGVVGRSSARMAQEVKKGDVLFWITAVQPLRVLFTVPESEMAHFPAGARLALTTADYPDLKQEGRILRVSPVVDPASGSVQVVGVVVHPSPLLKPGMTMQVQAGSKQGDGR